MTHKHRIEKQKIHLARIKILYSKSQKKTRRSNEFRFEKEYVAYSKLDLVIKYNIYNPKRPNKKKYIRTINKFSRETS